MSLSAFSAIPIISNAPESQTIFIGDPVIFSVSTSGTAPLSYQSVLVYSRHGAGSIDQLDQCD
jgi:hypothetical protein